MTLEVNKGVRMTANVAFANEKYIQEQKSEILERSKKFSNKLYLEFGGKLLFDYHASRVLPGSSKKRFRSGTCRSIIR